MEWFSHNLLTVITFFPLAWALVGLALPLKWVEKRFEWNAFGIWAFVGSLITFGLSWELMHVYDPMGGEFQLVEYVPWIKDLNVAYQVGMDGISLWLIILTTFLTPLAILGSFGAIEKRKKEYYFLLMALETGMLGAFVALDLIVFYIFWEIMLVPMYLLIGIWGGQQRIYAAMKFFLYTVVGSLLMLVAIFYLSHQHHQQFGAYSTSLMDLYRLKLPGDTLGSVQSLLFLAFAFAFAIKVPLFPFHTWLPDAHVQAPTAGSVILAGVLLKMGGYGFVRFAFPLFPEAVMRFQFLFMLLGAIAVVYGAWVAMIQPDIKKLVAYSSVSHMGFVVLGLFSLNGLAATGSIYQMLNHGISTGALFLLVGILYERRHTREISQFGGITKVMPVFAVVFLLTTFSSIALPGTNGFVGEFLILLGSFQTNPWVTAVAGTGVVFGAVYMLWLVQRVFFGPIRNNENKELKDLTLREVLVMAPLMIAVFFMGIYPNFFLSKMENSVQRFLKRSAVQTAYQKEIPNPFVNRNPSMNRKIVQSTDSKKTAQKAGG